jgi:hypothetical protein
MTRADPGGTFAQNSWRSSKQASARGTSKRMSLDAYSMILRTRDAHAGDWISSLPPHPSLNRLGTPYSCCVPCLEQAQTCMCLWGSGAHGPPKMA